MSPQNRRCAALVTVAYRYVLIVRVINGVLKTRPAHTIPLFIRFLRIYARVHSTA